MTKDYVRKRQIRQRSNVPKQSVMLLTSFLCGYLTATVFDFTSLTTWFNKNILNHNRLHSHSEAKKVAKRQVVKPKFEFYTLLAKDNSPPSPSNRAIAANNASYQATPQSSPTNLAIQDAVQSAKNAGQALPQPVFNQKTPSAQTSLTAQQVRQLAITDNKLVGSANRRAKEAYLIQVAAFNKHQDAEHLKVSLLLHGFDVKVSPFLKENVNWYRVIVGPFPSRAQALKAQIAVAKSERMKGMIRKIDV